MAKIRVPLISLVVILVIVFSFYIDNRTFNQLKNDQTYPMVAEPNQHPQQLTGSSMEIAETGVYMTKLYNLNNSRGLYFGIWYSNRHQMMRNEEKNWKRENGHIDFLVKAVDSNGTTYNGRTNGVEEGTFSTFRYVQINDFRYDRELDELKFSFYPLINDEEENFPNERAWLETAVHVE